MTREEAIAALLVDVHRDVLWRELTDAILRSGQAVETTAELLVEVRRGAPREVVDALDAHPLGATVAAERAMITWARRSPAGGARWR